MAGRIGRKVVFTWNGAEVTGVREKGITVNGDPIDVTADDDDGIRLLLSEAAELSVEIALSGVTKEDTLLTASTSITGRTQAVTLTWPDGSIMSGDFFLANYSEGNPYKDASTFQATLQSSGAVTYTSA